MTVALEAFLEHHVEHYLFGDLENMTGLGPLKDKDYGEAGYPMVASTVAGIELLGGLLSPSTWNKNAGKSYFKAYWEGYLEKFSTGYSRWPADAIYELVRHGLAHMFLTKEGIFVTKRGNHLDWDFENKTLYIAAVQFAQDFEGSYWAKVRKPIVDGGQPGVGGATRATMQLRTNEILDKCKKDAERLFGGVQTPTSPNLKPSSSQAEPRNTSGSGVISNYGEPAGSKNIGSKLGN